MRVAVAASVATSKRSIPVLVLVPRHVRSSKLIRMVPVIITAVVVVAIVVLARAAAAVAVGMAMRLADAEAEAVAVGVGQLLAATHG